MAGLSRPSTPFLLKPFAIFTNSTIRAGLIGASLILIPNGLSAFSTAPMMAPIAAMVPPSPAPFTPSGLSGEADSGGRLASGGMAVPAESRGFRAMLGDAHAPPVLGDH